MIFSLFFYEVVICYFFFSFFVLFFFFNDTATTEIYTLSLPRRSSDLAPRRAADPGERGARRGCGGALCADRKSTRLNSSHMSISYAVFCLKKKKKKFRYVRAPWASDFNEG